MKQALSTFTAIALLAVFLFLGTSRSFACSDCVCATDNTCSNTACTENLTANCSRVEFTAECTGDYDFYAMVTSCGDACGKCNSCVNLFKLSGTKELFIANCHTTNCNIDDCVHECTDVFLNANDTYVLYVCKTYCPGYSESCEDCDESCVAVGCVSLNNLSMPCTP